MGVGNSDTDAVGFGMPDQVGDLFADSLRYFCVIDENVPLGIGHMKQAGGLAGNGFRRCTTVDEEQPSLFQNGKDLIHTVGVRCEA